MATARLGDVVSIKGGGTPSKSQSAFYTGDIPWVTPKDMKSWDIVTSQDKITEEAVRGSATSIIPENAILIVNRSGILKHTLPVGINRLPVAINQDIKALICGRLVEPDYLARIIKAAEPIILGWVRATTADNFPIDNLRELEIPLPCLEEQKRIATILDQADNLRRLRQRAIDRLNSLGQAIFHEMFVSDCEAANWPVTTVAELAEQTRTGPFGSQLLHCEFVDDGIAVLGIDNAVNNEFCWTKPRHITPEKYRDLKRYTVRPGDVLITLMGTCGRCAVVPDDIPLAINTKQLCCITLRQDLILPEYLHSAFLQHPRMLKQLGVQAKGAVMPGLNMSIIRELKIVLPPMNIQRAYNKRKMLIARQLRSLVAHQAHLDTLFASSQYRAFRGEL